MTHLIQRQYIHLDLQGSESEGFALQNRLPELCSQALWPALERVLDRYAPPEGNLYIERLELDLGDIPYGQLEQELPDALTRALEKALSEQVPPGEAAFGQDGGTTQNAHLKSGRQVALGAFVHFLETGRLPWSFRLPVNVNLEQFLLDVLIDKSHGDQAGAGISAAILVPVLRASTARRRLVVQFSEDFLDRLLQSISPEIHTSLSRIRAALRDSGRTPEQAAFEKHLWEMAFERAISAPASVTVESGPASLAAIVLAAKPEAAPVVLPALKEILKPELPLFINQLRDRADERFSVLIPALKAVFSAASLPDMQRIARKKPTSEGLKVYPPIISDSAAAGKAPSVVPPEEGIYVDNAGLVILHPFLQMFFEGLGIARDGALTQPDRALHLLHFLCTGQTPAPEYELTLPKILCNIPLDNPVEADIVLTDNEKEEAGALLAAAIRWWEALRNTGPDALRGAFLCRPGKLSVRDDHDWLLQVERQSYDVLLDHLPWGISAVKLPWMEKMVWVEWG